MNKRLAAVLAGSVLMASLAAPGFAAEFKLSGEFNNTFMWAPNYEGFTGKADKLRVTLTLDKVKAGDLEVSFETVAEALEEGDRYGNNARKTALKNMNLGVSAATITLRGAWWEGGPSVVSKFGTVGGEQDSWVANLSGDGISISGLSAGPVALQYDHIWRGVNRYDQVNLLFANMKEEMVEFKGTAVFFGKDINPDKTFTDVHVGTTVTPTSRVTVKGDFASDSVRELSALRASVELGVTESLKLNASYLNVGGKVVGGENVYFDPEFIKYVDDNRAENQAALGIKRGEARNGVTVGAETKVADIKLIGSIASSTNQLGTDPQIVVETGASTSVSGVDLGGKIARTTKTKEADKAGDKLAVEASIGKTVGSTTLSYKLNTENYPNNSAHTNNGSLNTVSASTKIDIGVIKELNLDAKVYSGNLYIAGDPIQWAAAKSAGQNGTVYGLDATWKAPNGLNLGTHYYTYNQLDKGPIANDNPGHPDHFWMDASISLSF